MKYYKILITMCLSAAGLIFAGAAGIRYLTRPVNQKLESMLKQITLTELPPQHTAVSLTDINTAAILPDITEYPLCVIGTGDKNAEIISSPEKAGSGTDGWLIETAQAFNACGFLTEQNEIMSVSVRCLPSGLAMDYITSGLYIPDAYTPSNLLWGELAAADGAVLSTIAESLVPNTAGILIPADFPEMSFSEILQACMTNQLAIGYTYPYTSSAGLNFLLSALSVFDPKDPLSDHAAEMFRKFQASVPFVCYTTQQMHTAVNHGALNAFVTEYQIYQNDPALQNAFQFIPFGIRHDNPLYATSAADDAEIQVLHAFADYCHQPEQQKKAAEYGFIETGWKSSLPDINAVTIRDAQKLWKKEKNAGRPTAAVFIADCSGSMNGEPLNRMKTSLLQAAEHISNHNYIGLLSYDTQVYLHLPLSEFDLYQRGCFAGAVQNLTASGETCTYDAVLQGLHMLLEFQKKIPDVRLMLFVLSDGETNTGYQFSDIQPIVAGLKIPVYTISYQADLSELEQLSALNEAACIHADSQDVIYQMKALFNAQM